MKIYAHIRMLKNPKILCFVVFVFVQSIFIPSYSQTSNISLKLENQSIKTAFDEIEKSAGVIFFFVDNDIDLNRKVSIDIKDKSIPSVLEELFKNSSNTFRINGKQIYITLKPKIIQPVQKEKKTVKITGQITDENKQAVIGATILLVDAKIGTLTDVNGQFSIEVPENSQLKISYVGYENELINIDGISTINISLKQSIKTIDEVVVLAFGTQKKENVTGAISTVSGRDLVSTPVGNITNALIGTATGISGLQSSGEPGRNTAAIYIRGRATYGNSQPLIVIDGIEQPAEQAFTELNNMDPNEISGMSVLKDAASTAVYGIRGANGVIIVTTKKGSERKPVINLSLNYGSTRAIELRKQATSYEWGLMRNEAVNIMSNDLGDNSYNSYLFSNDDLWKMKNNRDFTPAAVAAMTNLNDAQKDQLNNSPALYYGSTDFNEQMFGNSAPQKQLNLNVSGGTKKVKYFTSLGYFTQDGIGASIKYFGANTKSSFERYNFRANFDLQVNKNTDITINLTGQFGTTIDPTATKENIVLDPYSFNERYTAIGSMINEGTPLNLPGLMDGKLVTVFAGAPGSAGNPLGLKNVYQNFANPIQKIITSGRGVMNNTLITNNIKINHTLDYLTKGLSIHATANYQNNYTKYLQMRFAVPEYTIQRNPIDPNKIDYFGGNYGQNQFNDQVGYNYTWSKIYFDAGIDYNRTFGSHKVTALLLGKASIYSMPYDTYNTPSGVMGLVGRVTYNFKDKYLLEYNLGLNGTEQFAPGNRFGFFPAYSIGWVPTNEAFFRENKWVTFMKIRGSYGEVGNDLFAGRRYLYLQSTYNMNQNNQTFQGYYLGNSNGSTQNAYYTGTTEGVLGNPNVTWERSKKLNIGFEIRFFSNKLSFTYEYFDESRSNILTTSGLTPAVFGVDANATPPINIGKTVNRGYEVSTDWKDKIGKLGYSINLGLSNAKNKVIYRAEAPNPYYWMNLTGFPIGQYYGLVSDGFFNTAQELTNRPYNTYTANIATLGDIRYKDINGDGKIDNKDYVPIGYTNLPEYHFSAKIGFNFKGFDLSVLIVGTTNGSYYVPPSTSIPFQKGAGNLWKWQFDERWTAEKAAAGSLITFPRAGLNELRTSNNFLQSDFWLKSSDYVRIKNVELGYSVPTKLINKFKISKLRIYCNANNLFTFKNALSIFGIDPESTDYGADYMYAYFYPLTRVTNVGLSIQF